MEKVSIIFFLHALLVFSCGIDVSIGRVPTLLHYPLRFRSFGLHGECVPFGIVLDRFGIWWWQLSSGSFGGSTMIVFLIIGQDYLTSVTRDFVASFLIGAIYFQANPKKRRSAFLQVNRRSTCQTARQRSWGTSMMTLISLTRDMVFLMTMIFCWFRDEPTSHTYLYFAFKYYFSFYSL